MRISDWSSDVCSSDLIARWPLLGWLATRAETIYHARGSADSLNGVMHQMAQRLRAGRAVAAFPEGRTTSGAALGTFHARIFQPAISAGALVQRSEEHTSELQSLMRISYAVFCLTKKNNNTNYSN